MLIMALDVDGCEDRGGKRRGGANGGGQREGVGEEGEKGGQLFATRSWVRCTSRVSTLGLQCSRQGLQTRVFRILWFRMISISIAHHLHLHLN